MMTLDTLLSGGVFTLLLVFTRVGSTIMLLPGFGDMFIPMQFRLLLAVGFSFLLTPILAPFMPPLPGSIPAIAMLLLSEGMIGIFIGTIARFFLSSLETAGQLIANQTGLAAAMMFNPQMSAQSTVISTLLSQTGVLLILVTNTHHLFLQALLGSYNFFPVGLMPNTGDMAATMTALVAQSFVVGIQIAGPFFILGMVFFIGLGLLARLMPQLQIFFISQPVQIVLGLFILVACMGTAMDFWLRHLTDNFMLFLTTQPG